MRRSTTPQAAQKPAPRPINPKFKSRLPGIMAEICDRLIVIEPAIEQINEQLREFLDYLEFEIVKTEMEIKQIEWMDKVEGPVLSDARAWLKELQQLKSDFNVEAMTSPPRTIRSMVDRVRDLFGVKGCEVFDLTA